MTLPCEPSNVDQQEPEVRYTEKGNDQNQKQGNDIFYISTYSIKKVQEDHLMTRTPTIISNDYITVL